ncbi:MAG: M20/M25/M40 family metallo-hydrolase [Spirochaetales bacterium]|nr:M20/M25/M40 family metallo-hydrolase [Spirochaetales bacterium]
MNELKKSTLSASEKLSRLVQYKTISYNEEDRFDSDQFQGCARELEVLFPECHRVMQKETFGDYALLYKWEGKNQEIDPAVIIAHFDVVPIDDENEWTHPPFSGDISEGFIWGRGTIDIKNQICAVMEACENMITEGFRPERTVYLAWGGDEEVSGNRGAKIIARKLEERDVRFAFLMDEGGAVSPDQMSMLDKPVALIGVEEKGIINLLLSCSGKTGHSSMPPAHTAIGILSAAIKRVEEHPFPTRFTTGSIGLFKTIAPHCRGIYKIIFGNFGLFGGLIKRVLSSNDSTNAMIRTSQSVTMIKGGYRENVLPDRAECNINFRILPGETTNSVKKRIEDVIDNPEIKVEVNPAVSPNEPVLMRSLDTPYFDAVCKTINKIWPDAVPAPYLVMGGTDSKNYENITDNIFRFSPMMLEKKEMAGMHGVNERISIENLENMVSFYHALLTLTCGKEE